MNSIRGLFVAVAATIVTVSGAQAQTDTLRLYSRHDKVPLDPNGFLFNPRWLNEPAGAPDIDDVCRFRAQAGELDERTLWTTATHHGPCLSADEWELVTLNEASATLGLGFVCATSSQIGHVRGHVNWFPVTVTGQVFWHAYAGGVGEDQDLTFDLAPPDSSAVTSGNDQWAAGRRVYHIEFNYKEALDPIGLTGRGWWYAVNRLKRRNPTMHGLVDRRVAIVTGLYGLDGVHDFQAELHPVFAMSVLIDTARTGSGRLREEWAVLVRNRGNEGDCASGSHPMITGDDSVQTFVVDLGVWSRAGAPLIYINPSFAKNPTRAPRMRADTAHVYVAFQQARPGPGAPASLFVGTLYVEWSKDGDGSPLARFDKWMSRGAFPLNLSPVPGVIAADTVQQAPEVPPGVSKEVAQQAIVQRDSMARMRERGAYAVRQQLLDPLSGWEPTREPRVQQNIQLAIQRPVGKVVCPSWRKSLCRNPFRLVLAGTTGPPFGGMAGVFVYAHGLFKTDDIRSAFGYRVDVRTDRFRRKCDTTCTPVLRSGWSAHVSAVLAPNSWRVGRLGTFTVYSIGGVGVSRLQPAGTSLAWSLGFGVQRNDGWLLEYQNYGRKGRFLNYWTVNFGYML